MIRFLIAFKKRPELNLEKYIGQYEFSVVPRSLFRSDGKLFLESKKADVMHEIDKEMKQPNASQTNEEQAISEGTAIFDGMVVVNKIKLRPAAQNCRQLAEAFLRIVLCEVGDAFEICVVFDRYLESPLKESTREKHGHGLEVTEYEIAANTSFEKIH